MSALFTFPCPNCSHTYKSRHMLNGTRVTCGNCGIPIEVSGDGAVSIAIAPTRSNKKRHEPEGVLEWLEDLFIKMIRGIFKFIFLHVPRKLYAFLIETFPVVARSFKVALLGIVWLLLTFGLLALTLFPERIAAWTGWPTADVSTWLQEHRLAWNIGVYVYTTLAVLGSGWGTIHIKRRRRQSKSPQ